jgi:ABC-type multidrug transport system permease subunit
MSKSVRILLPLGAGLAGAVFLTGLYLVLVSWAESPQHAIEFLWQDRWIVLPIILGFGVQTTLYVILKKRLFVPVTSVGPSGVMTGASGATSTIAMAACCAHHITDVLPILGLTAAATFLAEYRTAFMLVGLVTTIVGIAVMLMILFTERRKVLQISSFAAITEKL